MFGAMQEVALKPGGATIPVTEKNKVGAYQYKKNQRINEK